MVFQNFIQLAIVFLPIRYSRWYIKKTKKKKKKKKNQRKKKKKSDSITIKKVREA